MRDDVLAYLRCPSCEGPLKRFGSTAKCPAGHHFDVARQGYLNLLTHTPPNSGDSADMVAARAGFLAKGHYDFVVEAIRDVCPGDGFVVEVGAGPGHYLAGVLTNGLGLALDVSTAAARRAARAHPRASAVVADIWRRLPIADGSVSLLLDVFAPRNGPEFHRVLRPDGRLVVVTPAPEHLRELVDELGLLSVDPSKAERVAASLAAFAPLSRRTLTRTLRLAEDDVRDLVAMGPSAHHAHAPARALTVTAAVELAVYRPA